MHAGLGRAAREDLSEEVSRDLTDVVDMVPDDCLEGIIPSRGNTKYGSTLGSTAGMPGTSEGPLGPEEEQPGEQVS